MRGQPGLHSEFQISLSCERDLVQRKTMVVAVLVRGDRPEQADRLGGKMVISEYVTSLRFQG